MLSISGSGVPVTPHRLPPLGAPRPAAGDCRGPREGLPDEAEGAHVEVLHGGEAQDVAWFNPRRFARRASLGRASIPSDVLAASRIPCLLLPRVLDEAQVT